MMMQVARTLLSSIPEAFSVERFNDDVDRKIDALVEVAKEKEVRRERMRSRSRSFLACDYCGKEDCDVVCTGSMASSQRLVNLFQEKFAIIAARVLGSSQEVAPVGKREDSRASSAMKLTILDDDESQVSANSNIPIIRNLKLSIADDDD
jgi:hypothetical protein